MKTKLKKKSERLLHRQKREPIVPPAVDVDAELARLAVERAQAWAMAPAGVTYDSMFPKERQG